MDNMPKQNAEALVQQKKGGNDTALDSEATEHCAQWVKGELKNATVTGISGLSGAMQEVKGMNKVRKVRNVMCIPGISRNLLSVGRLLDQYGGELHFTKSTARLVGEGIRTVLAKRSKSGLYIVCNRDYQLGTSAGEAFVTTPVSVDVAKQRIKALHRAFGHASRSTLKVILVNRNFEGLSAKHLDLLEPCDACLIGKAHKAAKYRKGTEKAEGFGIRLCTDCTGPFRTLSISRNAYLLVIVDEHTAWTWAVPLKSLEEVCGHIASILEVDLHQRDDVVVKFFRSDGGTEFTNNRMKILLAKHGIVKETTCANTSYQNGKAERRIRTVFDRVRTTLSDAGNYLSAGYWAEAAVYAAYTLNRTPSEDGKSPFELRYKRKPKISHLRPFGKPCIVYRPRTKAGKEKDAGIRGTFLGYGYVDGKRGYRVRINGTNKVQTSKDVSFCAYHSEPREIGNLVSDTEEQTPSQVITTPANAEEISATQPIQMTQHQ